MSVAKPVVAQTPWQEEGVAAGEETQGARRAPGDSSPAATRPQAISQSQPDPEVVPKAERRRFSTAYKLRILDQADRCTGTGEIGALLRREGLFASHLSKWRKLRDQGALGGTASPRRGRKPDPATPLYRRAKELEQENEILRRKLRQAEIIIEVQKKVSEILDISLGSTEERS